MRIKSIISGIVLLFMLPLYCQAIEVIEPKEVQTTENEQQTITTDLIDYESITQKAFNHSYDIKIADFNILISKQGIRGARSEYFPKLIAKAGTEYTKSLKDYSVPIILGDSYINPYTRYQSLFGISMTYSLFDFGIRRKNLDIAKEQVNLDELVALQTKQDLEILLCENYTKIYLLKTQIDYNKEILKLENENVEYKTRLYEAKEITSTELNDAIVKRDKIQNRINEISQIAQESLNWLGFYTGETYAIDKIQIAELKKPDFDPFTYTDYTQTLIWKIKEKELKKKELEIDVIKKTNYPKVNVYSSYYLFGSNHGSYPKAYKDFEPSNFAVGGSVTSMLFDGMKNRSNIEATKLEYQKLLIERDKAIAEFSTKLVTLKENYMYIEKEVTTSENTVKELSEKEKSIKKLANKKLASPIEANDAKIELLEQKIELAKNAVTLTGILKGIQILSTY